MVESVSGGLCVVARALQQPGVLSGSGFYYQPDVGPLAILLEHQVSWWKDSTRAAFQTAPGSLELCLHVRGDKSPRGEGWGEGTVTREVAQSVSRWKRWCAYSRFTDLFQSVTLKCFYSQCANDRDTWVQSLQPLMIPKIKGSFRLRKPSTFGNQLT